MMHGFTEIDPKNLTDNPFKIIGADWMLITAGPLDNYNTMTASWGGFGHLWDRDVTYCFIRPKRYTYGFVEKSDYFSFSFFDEKFRGALNFCGTHSGINVNKAEKTGLTPVETPGNTVSFGEARLVIVSKKLYIHDLDRNGILDPGIIDEYYPPDDDIHRLYIGEVVSCLVK